MTADILPVSAEVVRVVDVTPRMRRVTFAGPEVAAFLTVTGPPNIKLYFPDADGRLDLPAREHHRYVWAPGQRERVRTYTMRRADAQAGELDVDFVRHGDEGLASAWAERARPGDRLGLLAGGGLVPGVCDWIVLVADETGLPAVGWILEGLPATTRGLAIVEVADAGEEQDLVRPPGVEVRWLHRDGALAGSTRMLQDAVLALDLPPQDVVVAGGTARIWVAAESAVVRELRRHLREAGFDRRQQLIIGYWHHGITEVGYGKESDHDRVEGELEVEPGDEAPVTPIASTEAVAAP